MQSNPNDTNSTSGTVSVDTNLTPSQSPEHRPFQPNRRQRRRAGLYRRGENKFTNILTSHFAEQRLAMTGDTPEANRLRNIEKRLRKQVVVYVEVA